jgi:serine/threonine-protein kinase
MSSKGELEGAETLPPEADTVRGPAPSPTAPPVAKWDRYELLDLLGKGGMGVVYKARDRRLDRTVAIKFILGADPNLTMRFLREARAQARIDHPNVCRVYEVGEVEGRAYIAIQFVEGETLNRAASKMSLDQKVAVMRDVALAIQEAHRLGIVHRDLKPGNVMVERSDDGRWLPIVMDFGLAREATIEAGITESGALIGTPAYMSPEQARGDVRAVDRRSDVYSLGATLYELITGRPPFSNESLAIALQQVIHDSVPAPRSLDKTLPVDLETIALKCLNKDPGQRYASARALADDLSRYLDGEPILGRRPSLTQRLRSSARRHRALFALGAWSSVIILALGAFGVRSFLVSRRERSRTVERTRLAERLGQDAKEIEWLLRAAYQLPLHDTRPERDVIRARMRIIADTKHDLGALGDAVVHDALGRGHLALHEWREAADELARAAAAGLNTPELHAARGRALGELYHRSYEEARRSGDKTWLAAQQKELEQRYLAPALAELEESRKGGESAALLDALIPLYRRDFETAERRALAAAERSPWRFEARKIAADAAYAAAVADFDRGSYDAARPVLERATTLYAQAGEVARSDASVYEAAAQTWLERAEIDFRQGRSPEKPLVEALAVVDRALAADPEDAGAYTTKAYVLLLCFRARLHGPANQRALLDQLEAAARKATQIEPRDANAWDALGNAHVFRGTYEMYHGGKGEPWWRRGLDEFKRALAIRPDDPWANNDVGVAHRWIGTSLDDAGEDPMPEYRAALAAYEHATHVDPEYVYGWANQTDLQASLAEYQSEHEIDPRAAVDGARRAGERGLAIDASYYLLLDNMAKAQLSLVDYLIESGGDPSAALAAARTSLDRADKIRADNMTTWFYRALAAREEARYRVKHGGDTRSAIADGRAALARALKLAPTSADAWVERAELDLVEAAAGNEAILAQARADAEKAIALDDQFAPAKVVAAEACLALVKATPSRAVADRGIEYADQALALNPRLPRAKELREALRAGR